jgi:hypothetical protein
MKWLLAVVLVFPLPAQLTVKIHQIQGSGAESPLAGQRVETEGIVTGRRSNGFYIQSRAEDADANPATSEGLLVFTRTAPPPAVVPGALARVRGTVTEFRPASDPASPPLTELTEPEVTILSTGNPLPAPVLITAAELYPAGGLEVLEPFEGMRVRVEQIRAVSPTINAAGIFYAVLEGTPRPFREPGLDFDQNPERLRIDPSLLGAPARPLHTGVRWQNVTGIVDYGFRTYTLAVEPQFAPPTASRPAPVPVLEHSPEEISVASMNLRRLAPTDAARIEQIGATIRAQLHLPDIVAVQEVLDLPTLERLAAAVGPAYRAFLEEGNDPGGIDTGFLVNTARINVISVRQEEKDATYRTPAGAPATLHDRPPLVLTATLRGRLFFAINVHLRSLIDAETPAVRAKRQAQAEAIAALAARLQLVEPAAGLLVLGDFNAFQFDDGLVDTLGIITARANLFNLTQTLPRDQHYSYVFDGNAQTLDHILVNPAWRARLSRYQVAHLNADIPDAFNRYTDHDHPVAHFLAEPSPATLTAASVTNAATFLTGLLTPGQLVTVFNSSITPDTTVLLNGGGTGLFSIAAGQATFTVPQLGLLRLALATGGILSNEVSLLATAAAVPGVFAAQPAPGDPNSVDLVITGWNTEPLHVWVDGRLAGDLASPAPYVLRARVPPAVRRMTPVPVFLVSGDQTSQPGVTVTLPNP